MKLRRIVLGTAAALSIGASCNSSAQLADLGGVLGTILGTGGLQDALDGVLAGSGVLGAANNSMNTEAPVLSGSATSGDGTGNGGGALGASRGGDGGAGGGLLSNGGSGGNASTFVNGGSGGDNNRSSTEMNNTTDTRTDNRQDNSVDQSGGGVNINGMPSEDEPLVPIDG